MNQNLLQLLRQLQAIWNQLGLNQRIGIALSTLAVLGGLLAIGFWSSRGDYSLLYSKLDDSEAARVIAALDENKVPYKFSQGSGSLLVPSGQVHKLRMQLAARGIPRGDGVGFEIFDKPNFGISDFVQRANYLRAVQGELARTIGEVNEVESARVMIVIPENRLLVDDKKHPTASVFVRVRGNTTLAPSSINSIRFLVANSVEGLQPNHVSVVDNHGNVLSENSDDNSIAGLSSSQLGARRNLEQYLARKAEGMLEKVLGPGQAVVRVAAEINLDTINRVEENYDPEGQVIRISTINDENNDSTTSSPNASGAAGAATNSNVDTNGVTSLAGNNSRLRRKVINNQYEINKTTSNVMQSAGGIKRVSAAVFVAQKFEGAGAERKPVARTPEEIEKLRRIVQSAIGAQNGAERSDEVTLEEMPFNDQTGLELTTQLDTQQTRQFWWDMGVRSIYPALGLALIAFFWRAFKKTAIEQIPIGIPLNQWNQAGGRGTSPARTDAPGVVTVDVLNQLIRENPDNMTQAIRGWLTKGKNNANN
jgi:flagellar M-ring protein FliF